MLLKNKIISKIAELTRKHHPRGTEFLIRKIYNPDNRKDDNFSTIINYDDNMKMYIKTDSFIEWKTFFFGFYEEDINKIIKNFFKYGFIGIDVGANVGVHTLTMAKLVQIKKDSKIYSFEPHPLIIEKLKKNINLNELDNVEIINKGLSDESGEAILYSFDTEAPHQGIASLYQEHSTSLKNKIKIQLVTLDEFALERKMKKLDFIKVDTEGNDLKVLKGGKKIIKELRPYIVLEYEESSWKHSNSTFESLLDFMKDINYGGCVVGRGGLLKELRSDPSSTIFLYPLS